MKKIFYILFLIILSCAFACGQGESNSPEDFEKEKTVDVASPESAISHRFYLQHFTTLSGVEEVQVETLTLIKGVYKLKKEQMFWDESGWELEKEIPVRKNGVPYRFWVKMGSQWFNLRDPYNSETIKDYSLLLFSNGVPTTTLPEIAKYSITINVNAVEATNDFEFLYITYDDENGPHIIKMDWGVVDEKLEKYQWTKTLSLSLGEFEYNLVGIHWGYETTYFVPEELSKSTIKSGDGKTNKIVGVVRDEEDIVWYPEASLTYDIATIMRLEVTLFDTCATNVQVNTDVTEWKLVDFDTSFIQDSKLVLWKDFDYIPPPHMGNVRYFNSTGKERWVDADPTKSMGKVDYFKNGYSPYYSLKLDSSVPNDSGGRNWVW